jgi:hypothetical protein
MLVGTGQYGVRIPTGTNGFSLLPNLQAGFGAHPAPYPMPTGNPFPGVKRTGPEINHSSPSSIKVKNDWSYTSTPLICLHVSDRKILLLYVTHIIAYFCTVFIGDIHCSSTIFV